MNKFIAKIFITGQIETKTGFRIGGSKAGLNIGDVDLNVIKNAMGIPFIPGSSLKGKLRSLLAREEGSEYVEDDSVEIVNIFGLQTRKDKKTNKEVLGVPTRLLVRDAFLNLKDFEDKKENEFSELELEYTETKWENTIDRKTGAAKKGGLRQLERVPTGTIFDFEIVYNAYDDGKKDDHIKMIRRAMRLLQDDYLGGHGSRGYGKVMFSNVTIAEKNLEIYKTTNEPHTLEDLGKGI